jgi:hypothetical protein
MTPQLVATVGSFVAVATLLGAVALYAILN